MTSGNSTRTKSASIAPASNAGASRSATAPRLTKEEQDQRDYERRVFISEVAFLYSQGLSTDAVIDRLNRDRIRILLPHEV